MKTSKAETGEGNAPRYPGYKNSRVRAYVDELHAALKEERSVGASLKAQRDELLAELDSVRKVATHERAQLQKRNDELLAALMEAIAQPDEGNAMAKILGCTQDQVKSQLAKNAQQLRSMEAEAKSKGTEVNGYTASDLGALALSFEQRSICDDESLDGDDIDERNDHAWRYSSLDEGRNANGTGESYAERNA